MGHHQKDAARTTLTAAEISKLRAFVAKNTAERSAKLLGVGETAIMNAMYGLLVRNSTRDRIITALELAEKYTPDDMPEMVRK